MAYNSLPWSPTLNCIDVINSIMVKRFCSCYCCEKKPPQLCTKFVCWQLNQPPNINCTSSTAQHIYRMFKSIIGVEPRFKRLQHQGSWSLGHLGRIDTKPFKIGIEKRLGWSLKPTESLVQTWHVQNKPDQLWTCGWSGSASIITLEVPKIAWNILDHIIN